MATLATQQLIASLYVAAFGRAPDKGGLAYWSAQMDTGFSFDNVVSSFLSSPEAEVRYGKGVSDRAFLTNLYCNVLNRDADEGGANYWQGRLTELGSRKDVVKEILSSISSSSGSDHQVLLNKVDVGLKFAASLSGYDQSYAKSILTYVTADPASVVSAGYLNDFYDNPPAVPGAAPLISLHEDSGVLGDGFTTNGTIDIGLPTGAQSWQYTTDAGQTWQAGAGTSFVLPDATYPASSVLASYVDASGVTSNFGSITSSLEVHSGLLLYGKTLSWVEVWPGSGTHEFGPYTGGVGIEGDLSGVVGGSLDITESTVKLELSWVYFLYAPAGSTWTYTDVGNGLAAFKSVELKSSDIQVFGGGTFDAGRFSVTDDAVTIDLSGVIFDPTPRIFEFSILG